MLRTTLATLLVILAAPAAGRAQTCFRARPAPECQGSWIVELNFEQRDGRLGGTDVNEWLVFGSATLGGMANVSPRWSLGGALTMVARGYEEALEGNGPAGRLGVVARARYWALRRVSLDLTAGLWQVHGLRPTVEAAIELGGLFALTAGARGDRMMPRRGEVYLGGRFSAEGAGVAAGVVALRILAAIATWHDAD